MVGRQVNRDSQEEILAAVEDYDRVYRAYCEEDSRRNLGERNGNYGHRWSEEARKKASLDRQQFYQNHPEAIQRAKERSKGRKGRTLGRVVYHNALGRCKYFKPEEVPGPE